MRKILLAILILIVVAVIGALFWNRAAHNRILQASDRASEETERLLASEFNRPNL
jgi:hypothetical protein